MTRLTLKESAELLGTPFIVSNCWLKLVESEHGAVPVENSQIGEGAKRLLNVVCSEEFIVMMAPEGRGSLFSMK